MNPSTYQELAQRTENQDYIGIAERLTKSTQIIRLDHAAKGLCTEAGEFTDALKKHVEYGNKLDLINLEEELGDLLWYVALACNALNVSLGEVMALNIKKLHGKTGRYKDQFTSEEASVRDLERERRVLENAD